jgi:hypothetical protein
MVGVAAVSFTVSGMFVEVVSEEVVVHNGGGVKQGRACMGGGVRLWSYFHSSRITIHHETLFLYT